MARIRSIKPEIWQSRDFVALSILGRLTFIALISNADDYGRLRTDAKHLARTLLVGAPVSAVGAQLDLMEEAGMIVRYDAAGHPAIALSSWSDHQKVDHPGKSSIAAPPDILEDSREARESSRLSTRAPADRTGSDQTGPIPHRNGPTAARAREKAVHNSPADRTRSKDRTEASGSPMTKLGDVLAAGRRRSR